LRNTLIAATLLIMVAAVAIGWFFSGYFLNQSRNFANRTPDW
jgi:hypothetical protein